VFSLLKNKLSTYISVKYLCMENNQITVTDLVTLKNIVDLASARGAFRPGEMKEIGEVYEKLTQFLEAVISQAQSEPDGAVPDETQGE
jgi:hypothetical protein